MKFGIAKQQKPVIIRKPKQFSFIEGHAKVYNENWLSY